MASFLLGIIFSLALVFFFWLGTTWHDAACQPEKEVTILRIYCVLIRVLPRTVTGNAYDVKFTLAQFYNNVSLNTVKST